MTVLTKQESYVKDLLHAVFVPRLHQILRDANPTKYAQWKGNCCRQTAVFLVPILRELLPDYHWSAWDGQFDDVFNDQSVHYNHAWVFGKHQKEDRRLLVDMSRLYKERLFIITPANRYPRDHPEYNQMRENHRVQLDIEKHLDENEFYTSRKGRDVVTQLRANLELKPKTRSQ